MNEELLKQIVLSSKVTKQIIENRISHPITGEKLPNRTFFVLLKRYVDDFFTDGSEPRMIGLAGLRGTGKTTLMWQLANNFFNKYPIYFFNVNEIVAGGYSLNETMMAFQKYILKKSFREETKPFILLFDEIHDSDDWTKALKILYDEARTAFILCTGSSAILLKQTADLARRMKIEKLYPFRFIEFITAKSFFLTDNKKTIYPLKGFCQILRDALFYSENSLQIEEFFQQKEDEINNYFSNVEQIMEIKLENLVKEYIYYHNIPAFLLYKEKSTILESIFDLLNRVVYQDIQKLDNTIKAEPTIILRLLFQLSISDEINLDSLSKITGIKKDELTSILDLIEKAELINILDPFSGAEGRIHKNKKAFFMSPSLRLSLLSILYATNIPENLQGKLYEDIVVMYLTKTILENQILFSRIQENYSPDFIVETMEKPIIIEVGKSKIKTDQLKSIEKRYGILISLGIKKVEVDLENNIIKLPLHYFLLL